MKASRGQPLHEWRLGGVARDGFGRELAHLTGRLSIAPEWPHRTKWSDPGAPPGPLYRETRDDLWELLEDRSGRRNSRGWVWRPRRR